MNNEIEINSEDDYRNIKIAGFSTNLTNVNDLMQKLRSIGSECTIQLMNADGVAGREHALHSTIHAIKAFKRNQNISKDLGLEICVRTSGQRQISQALRMLGLKEGHINVCAVAVGCSPNVMELLGDILGERDDDVLVADTGKLGSIYKLSDIEIETAPSISKLLIEKTSLLILET
jgi:KEOPS complex subunit Cgi121